MTSHRCLARRFGAVAFFAIVLLTSSAFIGSPRPARAAVQTLEITSTVDFAGCPSAISCASFPLMWGISGGEAVTAHVTFDDAIAPALVDDASPQYISARYDHALPLASPLGMSVQFGPYTAVAGSSGAMPDRYAISVFDDLGSGCCPGLPESMAIEILVPDFSFTLTGHGGSHDLDLRAIRLEFLNYGGAGNLLTGAAIVPGFQDLAWEEIRLTVDVYDPVYGRAGRAFIDVQAIETVTPPALPTLMPLGRLALYPALAAMAFAVLRQARRATARHSRAN